MRGQDGYFSRVARGEVKMHMESTSPYWWGEEVLVGIKLNWLMVKQPGFLCFGCLHCLGVCTIYDDTHGSSPLVYPISPRSKRNCTAFGALASRYYLCKPINVGVCVLALTLAALFAIPFEKASWLSRARYNPSRTDSMTLKKGIIWSSHMLRRILCTVLLPLAALASTLTYKGPPLHVAIPSLFRL
jgi:hypothetical protein